MYILWEIIRLKQNKIITDSQRETDKWLDKLERKIYQDAKQSGKFVSTENFIKQYEKQCKEEKDKEEKGLDKRIDKQNRDLLSTLKDVSIV